jgi:hypothetical protein
MGSVLHGGRCIFYFSKPLNALPLAVGGAVKLRAVTKQSNI